MESRVLKKVYTNHSQPWCHPENKEISTKSISGEDSQLSDSLITSQIVKIPASVDIDTFSAFDSALMAPMYCLAYTNACQEMTQDPDYISHVGSCQIDRLASIMQKPLNPTFWLDKKEATATCTQIVQSINKLTLFKKSANSKPPFFTFLERISRIFSPQQQTVEEGPMTPESSQASQGIYSYLHQVSRVGESKPVYYTKLDAHYETRGFRIMWDGSRTLLTSMRSAKLFLDLKVQDLAKTVEQEIDEYRDFIYFDPASRYEIPLKTRLRDLEVSELVASEIVTNLAPEDEPLTIKFTFERDSRVFFLLSFAHGKWYPSVAKEARRKISELLGVPEKTSFTIRYCKNQEPSKTNLRDHNEEPAMSSSKSRPNLAKRPAVVASPRAKPVVKAEKTALKPETQSNSIFREFDEAVDLFRLIFLNQANSEWPMFTEVFFDLPQEELKRVQLKPHKTHQFQAKLNPGQLLAEFYASKSKKQVSPSLSAQILILEYGQSSGIQASDLAVDFRSEYLDPCSYQYYQLRAVVIEVLEEKCGSLFVPIVKVDGRDGGQWFSPVHDSFLTSLTGLNIKSFIYERTFDTS